MRIAVATVSGCRFGGAESYLEQVVSGLSAAGNQVAVIWERDSDDSIRPPLSLPVGTQTWSIEKLGLTRVVSALSTWAPDVVFDQGVQSPEYQASLFDIAPTVLFAHNYHGTCVSGTKAWSRQRTCCDRILGLGCLTRYHLRGCGGRNPLTMLQSYRTQTVRLRHLQRCAAVLVASRHMKREYEQHGVSPERVRLLPYPTDAAMRERTVSLDHESLIARRVSDLEESLPVRLLYVGRIEGTKGVDLLVDALPAVVNALDREVQLTVAGRGSYLQVIEDRAQQVIASTSRATVKIIGWVTGEALAALYRESHLLVVPSAWPEPFGLIGLEAGFFALPCAAFPVGGITDWLTEGRNGCLAEPGSLTASRLATAICRAINRPDEFAALCRGAVEVATHWPTLDSHLDALQLALGEAASA